MFVCLCELSWNDCTSESVSETLWRAKQQIFLAQTACLMQEKSIFMMGLNSMIARVPSFHCCVCCMVVCRVEKCTNNMHLYDKASEHTKNTTHETSTFFPFVLLLSSTNTMTLCVLEHTQFIERNEDYIHSSIRFHIEWKINEKSSISILLFIENT